MSLITLSGFYTVLTKTKNYVPQLTKSRSYQTLFFFIFQFKKHEKIIDYEMAKYNSKKWEKIAFTKKKGYVGSTSIQGCPRYIQSFLSAILRIFD